MLLRKGLWPPGGPGDEWGRGWQSGRSASSHAVPPPWLLLRSGLCRRHSAGSGRCWEGPRCHSSTGKASGVTHRQAGCSGMDQGKQGADASWAPPVRRTPAPVMRHSPWARREHLQGACAPPQHVQSANQREAEAAGLVLGFEGLGAREGPSLLAPCSLALVCILLGQRPAGLMRGRVCRPAESRTVLVTVPRPAQLPESHRCVGSGTWQRPWPPCSPSVSHGAGSATASLLGGLLRGPSLSHAPPPAP